MFLISYLSTRVERSRLRHNLLQMDDHVLADIGYSRELLEAGLRAWPWRAPSDPAAGLGRLNLAPRQPEIDYAAAVAELKSYSDTELQDLGLTRGGIEEAVHNGRPGFPEERKAA